MVFIKQQKRLFGIFWTDIFGSPFDLNLRDKSFLICNWIGCCFILQFMLFAPIPKQLQRIGNCKKFWGKFAKTFHMILKARQNTQLVQSREKLWVRSTELSLFIEALRSRFSSFRSLRRISINSYYKGLNFHD